MSHEENHPDPAELAALHAAGALEPAEERALEDRLAGGDAALAREVALLGGVADALGALVDPVHPEARTREELLAFARRNPPASVATQHAPHRELLRRPVWRSWSPDRPERGMVTRLAHEGDWEETGVPGVRVRRLVVDRDANMMTAMFEMAPGSSYVPHVHDGPEECYVLRGDLRVSDDLVMRAGDFQWCPAGSRHGTQRTESGCLLLVRSSLSDEEL
jgi:quercetin dioxygenase-like cupin family protein